MLRKTLFEEIRQTATVAALTADPRKPESRQGAVLRPYHGLMAPEHALPFLDFYSRLPAGGVRGRSTGVFGIADMPEPFVAPGLRSVVSSEDAGLTFVSARGATGKSYFAQRISAMKAAPLWRLDLDRAVSGDAMSAKLAAYLGASRAKRFSDDSDALIVVDALDEARMRVSGVSWTDFLESLIPYATNRRLLFLGRERVIEDLWMYFDDQGVRCDWLEIAYFNREQRISYVDRRVAARGKPSTGGVYLAARDGVLNALAGTVDPELAESFVGYAPVLDAVVALLADENLMNVRNTFVDAVPSGSRIDILVGILESLLDREQRKVAPLANELGLEPGRAYGRDEQMHWLASDLMGASPPALEWCDANARVEYAKRIREFLRDHPFRAENEWASPVFSAYVSATRFDDPRLGSVLQSVGRRTGLLFDFVLAAGLGELIDERQFAALHASMLAAEWQSVEAAVALASPESTHTVDALHGELVLLEGDSVRRLDFVLALDSNGRLDVHGPTAFLSVDFPGLVVLTASNGSIALGPDCFIHSSDLRLEAESTEVMRSARERERVDDEPSVVLEVENEISLTGTLVGPPATESFELRVRDEAVLVYPWVAYRAAYVPSETAPDERAERFVRMLLRLLRRHGHSGRMAVFDMKLQGCQSIKEGEFQAAVADLEELGILSHEGALIYLQPAWEQHWFSGKGRAGLPTLEDKRDVWAPALHAISSRLS